MLLSITHELPMGHRLQNHNGNCRFLHGHNYLIKVAIEGIPDHETGMIVDFSDLKRVVRKYFEQWDHALVLEAGDPIAGHFASFGQLAKCAKLIELTSPPTAEALTTHWSMQLGEEIMKYLNMDVRLVLTVNETRDSEVIYG